MTLWLAGCLPCTADPDAAPANPCCAMCVNKRIRIVLVTHLYALLFFFLPLLEFSSSCAFHCHSFPFSIFPFDVAFRHVPGLRLFVTFVVSSLRNFLHLFQVCCPRTFARLLLRCDCMLSRISRLSVFLAPSCFAPRSMLFNTFLCFFLALLSPFPLSE